MSASTAAVNGGSHTEIVFAGLLLVIAALVSLARVLRIPYPIFLVIGGLGISLIPGLPNVTLQPDLVLLIFLPPLLYVSAFFTDLREMRRNLRPIGWLAVGLVIATTLTVGVAAHELIDGLPWAAAFTLGAICGPTDPVAATALAGRLGLPNRIVTICEGESLINDGTAIVAYKVAIAAVLSGSFNLLEASGRFVLVVSAGIAIGLAVGWLITLIRRKLDDPPTEITISILTGYLAYLPAEEIGASGVVACVTAGLYLGFRANTLQSATTRMQATAVWEVIQYLLNAVLFLLIGLQLPMITDPLSSSETRALIVDGLIISGVVIATRLLWTFIASVLKIARGKHKRPPWRATGLIGWIGMRGAVSLAAALAVPLHTDAHDVFPFREQIIFLTFIVILVTLCLQGLSLPLVVRWLKIEPDAEDGEEDRARLHTTQAAIDRIDTLAAETWTYDASVERARAMYAYRHRRFSAKIDGENGDPDDDTDYEGRAAQWIKIMRVVLNAQREALYELHDAGEIRDETMRRIERDLDLEEARFLQAADGAPPVQPSVPSGAS